MKKTNVRTHLRRKKHGKSIVRKHSRKVIGRRALLNFNMKKRIQEGLAKKPVYEVSNDNLLNAARNLYDRGEISLEQIGDIERRAKEMPLYETVKYLAGRTEAIKKQQNNLINQKKLELKKIPRFVVVEGPNGRPSHLRRIW